MDDFVILLFSTWPKFCDDTFAISRVAVVANIFGFSFVFGAKPLRRNVIKFTHKHKTPKLLFEFFFFENRPIVDGTWKRTCGQFVLLVAGHEFHRNELHFHTMDAKLGGNRMADHGWMDERRLPEMTRQTKWFNALSIVRTCACVSASHSLSLSLRQTSTSSPSTGDRQTHFQR